MRAHLRAAPLASCAASLAGAPPFTHTTPGGKARAARTVRQAARGALVGHRRHRGARRLRRGCNRRRCRVLPLLRQSDRCAAGRALLRAAGTEQRMARGAAPRGARRRSGGAPRRRPPGVISPPHGDFANARITVWNGESHGPSVPLSFPAGPYRPQRRGAGAALGLVARRLRRARPRSGGRLVEAGGTFLGCRFSSTATCRSGAFVRDAGSPVVAAATASGGAPRGAATRPPSGGMIWEPIDLPEPIASPRSRRATRARLRPCGVRHAGWVRLGWGPPKAQPVDAAPTRARRASPRPSSTSPARAPAARPPNPWCRVARPPFVVPEVVPAALAHQLPRHPGRWHPAPRLPLANLDWSPSSTPRPPSCRPSSWAQHRVGRAPRPHGAHRPAHAPLCVGRQGQRVGAHQPMGGSLHVAVCRLTGGAVHAARAHTRVVLGRLALRHRRGIPASSVVMARSRPPTTACTRSWWRAASRRPRPSPSSWRRQAAARDPPQRRGALRGARRRRARGGRWLLVGPQGPNELPATVVWNPRAARHASSFGCRARPTTRRPPCASRAAPTAATSASWSTDSSTPSATCPCAGLPIDIRRRHPRRDKLHTLARTQPMFRLHHTLKGARNRTRRAAPVCRPNCEQPREEASSPPGRCPGRRVITCIELRRTATPISPALPDRRRSAEETMTPISRGRCEDSRHSTT